MSAYFRDFLLIFCYIHVSFFLKSVLDIIILCIITFYLEIVYIIVFK